MNGTTFKQGAPNANTGNSFPWAGQPDETACNLAFGNLIQSLPARLTQDGKLHAPTLMAAVGAVAGVAAQVSLLADVERMEKARKEEKLLEVTLKDGRMFLYGDALNEMLYSVRDTTIARSRIWNMMVTAAVSKGLAEKDFPNVPAMFKHVSEGFGTDREGLPSTPANAQPIAKVRDLLMLVGPVAFAALSGEMNKSTTGETMRANRKSWVAITAQAAGNMVLNASRIMPPAVCLTIAMESAIYASKMRANAPKEAAPEVVKA